MAEELPKEVHINLLKQQISLPSFRHLRGHVSINYLISSCFASYKLLAWFSGQKARLSLASQTH